MPSPGSPREGSIVARKVQGDLNLERWPVESLEGSEIDAEPTSFALAFGTVERVTRVKGGHDDRLVESERNLHVHSERTSHLKGLVCQLTARVLAQEEALRALESRV